MRRGVTVRRDECESAWPIRSAAPSGSDQRTKRRRTPVTLQGSRHPQRPSETKEIVPLNWVDRQLEPIRWCASEPLERPRTTLRGTSLAAGFAWLPSG